MFGSCRPRCMSFETMARAAGAAAAGDRPVVAADGVGEGSRPAGQRRRAGTAPPAAPPGGRRGRHRRAAPARRRRRRAARPSWSPPAAGRPAGPASLCSAQPAARQLARLLVALQIEVHGPHHQQRIGRLSTAAARARQRIFERARAQRIHAVVDAGGIAFEEARARPASCAARTLRRGRGSGAGGARGRAAAPWGRTVRPVRRRALRRSRSIWKKRSWPCTKPVA